MAHGVIPLGAVPSGESAAQVGESGYAEVAFLQCTRYIALLRHTVGPEPAGARLRIRRAEADVDPYLAVVGFEAVPPRARARPCVAGARCNACTAGTRPPRSRSRRPARRTRLTEPLPAG